MVWKLRALATLIEDPGSVLSTHVVAQSHLLIPIPGNLDALFWLPWILGMHMVQVHTHAYSQTLIYIKLNL